MENEEEDVYKRQPSTPLLYVERLFYHDGRPSGINHVWFRESDVPGLTESTLLYNSISRTLKYTYHYDITKIENYIEAVSCLLYTSRCV